jgi:hypothetical protein
MRGTRRALGYGICLTREVRVKDRNVLEGKR